MQSIKTDFPFSRKRLPQALSLLPVFVILSLVAHIGALAVFQIVYPAPATGLRRTAEVYFLQPASAEAEKLAPWLKAADPALFSRFQTDNRNLFNQPALEYIPSFDLMRPHIPPLPANPLIPENKIHLRSAEAHPDLAQPLSAPAMKVDFSEPLQSRNFVAAEGFAVTPMSGEIPKNPVFSIGVAEDGRALYVLLERSSGQTELDVRAREYLLRGRFSPASEENSPPSWGRATFTWSRPPPAPAP